MNEWQPIETAPKDASPKGIMLIARTPNGYLSDPYFSWWDKDKWARWPHPFPPTHWLYLPEPPK